jgi:hypothetical protein
MELCVEEVLVLSGGGVSGGIGDKDSGMDSSSFESEVENAITDCSVVD